MDCIEWAHKLDWNFLLSSRCKELNVFGNDYTKDGIGVSNLACKALFTFLNFFITCNFIRDVHKESCIKSYGVAYFNDHNIFVWYLNLIKRDLILGVLGLWLHSCAQDLTTCHSVALVFKLFTTPNIRKDTILDPFSNLSVMTTLDVLCELSSYFNCILLVE